MFAQWFAGSDLLVWPLVGLGIFFVTFVAVVGRAVFGMRGGRADRMASLPLEEDGGAGEGRTG